MTNITLRLVKGSPLTNAEVDSNFSSLNNFKVEQTGSTKSALIPSGTMAQRDSSAQAGMFRYNTDLGQFEGYTTSWGAIGGGGIDSAAIIDLIDSAYVAARQQDIAIGDLTDVSTTGTFNLAIQTTYGTPGGSYGIHIGKLAGQGASGNCTVHIGPRAGRAEGGNTCANNVMIGASAGATNYGGNNIAVGTNAVRGAGLSNNNVGIGTNALCAVTTGSCNIAIGCGAANALTTGSNNIVIGHNAQPSSTTASNEITLGDANVTKLRIPGLGSTNGYVLTYSSATGGYVQAALPASGLDSADVLGLLNINNLSDGVTNVTSVGLGTGALATSTGINNTAVGICALNVNTTGANNVAIGFQALDTNNVGSNNTAIGSCALFANTTGCANVVIGSLASCGSTTGYRNVIIGHCTAPNYNSYGTVYVGYGAGRLVTDRLATVGVGYFAGCCGAQYGTFVGFYGGRCQTGSCGTGVGVYALMNGSGINNTAVGHKALCALTTGYGNTSVGVCAGRTMTTANQSVVVGFCAGGSVTHGSFNNLIGACAGRLLTTGCSNVAIGRGALSNTATARYMVAIGEDAANNGGTYGVAIGRSALSQNTADGNVAVGRYGLTSNTTGANNTAVGTNALRSTTIGSCNVAFGACALCTTTTGANNTAVGSCAGCTISTGSNNILLGFNAQPTTATISNEITLGDANIATFRIPGVSFSIDSNGIVNGVDFNSTSDINLKDSIESITNGLDIISQINPVTFSWKLSGKKAHGVIAQEIEQILPEVVSTNIEGNKTVAYSQLIAFLVDAVKSLKQEIEEIKSKL